MGQPLIAASYSRPPVDSPPIGDLRGDLRRDFLITDLLIGDPPKEDPTIE
jgi:hypothetical protein